MNTNPTPNAVLDQMVAQTIHEVVVTAGIQHSVRRMMEATLTLAELTKRIEEAGFGQLAQAVRHSTEATMTSFLTVLPVAHEQPPTAPALPPARSRKTSAAD